MRINGEEMAKRKTTHTKKSSHTLTYIAWILAIVAIIISSFIAGYYLGHDNATREQLKKEHIKEKKRLTIMQKLEDASLAKEKTSVNNRLIEVLKKESVEDVKKEEPVESRIENRQIPKSIGASHEYEGDSLPTPPERDIKIVSTKPKLAIIIDDVSVRSHVDAVKSLNLPITMSFLPPTKFRPNSSNLASKENFYMVHLPMEAKNFNHAEPLTLKVDDSQEDITSRVEEMRRLFPRVKYINNHAGSKFTSNETAMNRLIYALDKQKIEFVDSRTIASTKVPLVMKNYGKPYVARDVFLDHEMDKKYIKEQIKKAIQIAKIHGSAIAIGHPHANTILALSESKKLFKDVELVLINGLN